MVILSKTSRHINNIKNRFLKQHTSRFMLIFMKILKNVSMWRNQKEAIYTFSRPLTTLKFKYIFLKSDFIEIFWLWRHIALEHINICFQSISLTDCFSCNYKICLRRIIYNIFPFYSQIAMFFNFSPKRQAYLEDCRAAQEGSENQRMKIKVSFIIHNIWKKI
jgi:hypothetical protein